MKNKQQKGFTLLELSITTVLATAGIVAMIQMQSYQAQLESARSIAQIYQRLNNSVGSYMSTFYDQLVALPAQCSRLPYQAGSAAAPISAACNVDLSINGQTRKIANGLQPTPAELALLGVLGDAGGVQYVNSLPLPTYASDAGSPLKVVNSNNLTAPESFAVAIQFMCLAQSDGDPIQIYDKNQCKSQSFDLRSLVFNLQPYKLNPSKSGEILLYQVLQSAGGDAYLSDAQAGDKGELKGLAGSAERTIVNPLRWRKSINVEEGTPYVIAMRNGFGSSGYDQMLRRNGTQTLTAAWNVGDQDITGVKNLSAASGSFSGSLSAGSITSAGNISGGSISSTGNISGGSISSTGNITGQDISARGAISGTTVTGTQGGIFGNFTASAVAALKATTAYISEALTVAGDLTTWGANVFNGTLAVRGNSVFSGNLDADGLTSAAYLRLKSEANLGATCDPTQETMRRAAATSTDYEAKGLRFLVCDPVGKTWVRAQYDYGTEIAGITTNIGNINNTIGGINNTIGGINTTIGGITTNVNNLTGDLQVQVTNNKNSIEILKTDVDALKVTTGKLGGDVTLLKTGMTELQDNFMRWDIINITWNAAACTSSNSCVAKDKVWKKTPWRCNKIGTIGPWNGDDGMRWSEYASENQKGGTNSVPNTSTPPVIVGMDNVPLNDTWTYDINCGTTDQTYTTGDDYWYIGVSSVKSNTENGNACRSGLGSTLLSSVTSSYFTLTPANSPSLISSECSKFNVYAPSFNKTVMSGRFIAFTKKRTTS